MVVVVVAAAAGFMEKTRLFIMFTIYLLYGRNVSEQYEITIIIIIKKKGKKYPKSTETPSTDRKKC